MKNICVSIFFNVRDRNNISLKLIQLKTTYTFTGGGQKQCDQAFLYVGSGLDMKRITYEAR